MLSRGGPIPGASTVAAVSGDSRASQRNSLPSSEALILGEGSSLVGSSPTRHTFDPVAKIRIDADAVGV